MQRTDQRNADSNVAENAINDINATMHVAQDAAPQAALGPGRNVALIGFMGTGKSTVGRILARALGYVFVDSDAVIEARAGVPIRSLFMAEGETGFRRREREVIAELSAGSGQVIATGGGAAVDPDNAAQLHAGCLVVWLTAAPEVILRRVGKARNRPLLAEAPDPYARIVEILTVREPHYARVAHCRVETGGRRPDHIATEIVRIYRRTISS